MSTTIATTKGLPSSTHCVFLSQEVPESAECSVVASTLRGLNTIAVRAVIGEYSSMYYPEVKTLEDTHDGDRVLVEVNPDTWEPRIVSIDDDMATAHERASLLPSTTVTPFPIVPLTQHAKVLAGFALLYNDALNDAAYNDVRVALNDSADDATDDGSIDVATWQLMNDHVDAFEEVDSTYFALCSKVNATRETVPEKK